MTVVAHWYASGAWDAGSKVGWAWITPYNMHVVVIFFLLNRPHHVVIITRLPSTKCYYNIIYPCMYVGYSPSCRSNRPLAHERHTHTHTHTHLLNSRYIKLRMTAHRRTYITIFFFVSLDVNIVISIPPSPTPFSTSFCFPSRRN